MGLLRFKNLYGAGKPSKGRWTKPIGAAGVQILVTERNPNARKNCAMCRGGGEVPDIGGFFVTCWCVKQKIKRERKRELERKRPK